MQVVDIQAFSVVFAARSIPDSWSRIYCQTLPGLPRAARPSGRFAEGKEYTGVF